ncbi:MAG: hypothetical protein ACYTCN_09665 [Planctomycetota bacterium]|jgi:hypothetical protein
MMNVTTGAFRMEIERSTVCMTAEELAVIVLAGLESLPADIIGEIPMGAVQDCSLTATENGIELTIEYEKLEEE